MRKTFTTDEVIETKKGVKNEGPKQSTLEFLKQFARVYTYEPSLKKGLCEFAIN